MDKFSQARTLFEKFLKNQNYRILKQAIEILDELISEGASEKAKNLRRTINNQMLSELRQIDRLSKEYEISKFAGPNADRYEKMLLLFQSVEDRDFTKFSNALRYMVDGHELPEETKNEK